MDVVEMHALLGRARGVLEAQPPRPPLRATTRAAYRRYAERGLAAFASWDVAPAAARRFVRAAVRAVELERLAEAADGLEAALAAGDEAGANEAAGRAKAALEVLRRHPPGRPGRRVSGGGCGLAAPSPNGQEAPA